MPDTGYQDVHIIMLHDLEAFVPGICIYRNSETAQYTSSKAIIVFTALSFLIRKRWNTEPNNDQQQVAVKPTRARNTVKPARAAGDL